MPARQPLRLHTRLPARFLALLLPWWALAACGGGSGLAGEAVPPPPDAPLALTDVLPPAVDLGGGLTVSLRGTGFPQHQGPVFVHFGSRVASAVVVSGTLLQAEAPAGDEVGPVDVRVAAATGLAHLPHGFAYLPPPPPPPVLTCVPPVGSFSAPQGGTLIELRTANFAALVAPAVTFGGVPGTGLAVLSPTRLRVAVPAGLPAGQFVPVELTQDGERVTSGGFFSQGAIGPGDVTVNEFLPDPGTQDANRDGTLSSAGDEFVELVNRLGVAVDLTYFTLSDSSAVRHTFPNPTSVPPGGSIVVFGSGNPTFFAPRHESGHAQLAASGTLGLNNSADSVILRTPAGSTVAQANYANADVSPGRSRTAAPDAQALPLPAGSIDYLFHDNVSGAVGTLSPGARATGAAFP